MMIFCVFSLITLFNKYEQFNIIDGIDFLQTFPAKSSFDNFFVMNKLQFHCFELYYL